MQIRTICRGGAPDFCLLDDHIMSASTIPYGVQNEKVYLEGRQAALEYCRANGYEEVSRVRHMSIRQPEGFSTTLRTLTVALEKTSGINDANIPRWNCPQWSLVEIPAQWSEQGQLASGTFCEIRRADKVSAYITDPNDHINNVVYAKYLEVSRPSPVSASRGSVVQQVPIQ